MRRLALAQLTKTGGVLLPMRSSRPQKHRQTQRRETSERYTKCYSQQGLMMARPARRESDGAALTSESRNAEIMPRGVRLPLSPPLKLQDHESIYNKVQRLRGERYFQRFSLLLPQFVLRHPCHSGKRLRQDNNP